MEDLIGAIRLWPTSAIPKGWMACDGTLLSITNYSSLYTLLSTRYGGDGINTFALPDLRGKAVIGSDIFRQPNPNIPLGATIGHETVTLNMQQIPTHTHNSIKISNQPANLYMPCNSSGAPGDVVPENGCPSVASADIYASVLSNPPIAMMNLTMTSANADVAVTGASSNLPHNNMMPSFGLNYIICITGIYPTKP